MHHHLSCDGPPCHFAHANGFPLLTYRHFLEPLLRQFAVFGLQQRALWPDDDGPPPDWDWGDHADDLIAWLDRNAVEPVIGIGHSMGGTISLLAASRRPELFRALVLIDPAGARSIAAHAARLVPRKLFQQIPYIARTRQRVDYWDDYDAAHAYFSTRATWSVFTDAAMSDFLEHALVPAEHGGLKLAFSPLWEAHNYSTIAALSPAMRAVELPVLMIRGAESYVQTDAIWKKLKRLAPQHDYVTIAGAGHLLPQQVPEQTMGHIQRWLTARSLQG